jgi:hypothetical protein
LQSEQSINVDAGRPHAMPGEPDTRARAARSTSSVDDSGLHEDLLPGFADESPEPVHSDIHAAGTPGGGSAVGGLAGSTIGDGGTGDAGLNEAMGTSEFDVKLEEEDTEAYSGRSGGAVGGTPANKRAVGGRARRTKRSTNK